MSIRFYMDAHVPLAMTMGLRQRQVDVLTAQDDGKEDLDDPDLLDRAALLGRVLVTHDKGWLTSRSHRQRLERPHAGIIYYGRRLTIRRCIDALELVAHCMTLEELRDTFYRVPE